MRCGGKQDRPGDQKVPAMPLCLSLNHLLEHFLEEIALKSKWVLKDAHLPAITTTDRSGTRHTVAAGRVMSEQSCYLTFPAYPQHPNVT